MRVLTTVLQRGMVMSYDEDKLFEELLMQSESLPGSKRFRPGDQVSGVIALINNDMAFIDFGGKGEGWTELDEFKDENGELTVKVGDPVKLMLLEWTSSGAHFGSRFRSVSQSAGFNQIEDAFESKLPVEGKVMETNKGGFTVQISGVSAFCPISQIDTDYVEDPSVHVGNLYSFLITEFDPEDERVIISRRAFLQAERAQKADETRKRLQVGEKFKGYVRKIMPYGVFVDIGGIDGFVHISNLSHDHIETPESVVKVGETYDMELIGVEIDNKGRERVSLSMKALIADPWQAGLPFVIKDTVTGKVRRLESFGAFVEVAPGIDGLVHISQIARERINHPSEKLKEGDEVQVQIKDIDIENRRISLSIRALLDLSQPEVKPEDEDDNSTRKGNIISRHRSRQDEQPEQVAVPEPAAWPAEEIAASEAQNKKPSFLMPHIGLVTKGIVSSIKPYGVFVDLPECGEKARGLCHNSELIVNPGDNIPKYVKEGGELEVEIVRIDEQGRLALSHRSVLVQRERSEIQQYQNQSDDGGMGKLASLFKNIKLDK